MPSGGPRVGTPGASYTNRTDLQGHQPIRVATGQQYGQASAQRAAQQAVALPQQQPVDFPHPLAPTARPDEPVTQGAALGPGYGPQEAGITLQPGDDDVLAQLQGWMQAYPNSDIGKLLEAIYAGDHAPGGQYGPAMFG